MQKRSLHAMTNTAIMSVCVCGGGGGGSPPHGSINSWQLCEYTVSPNFIQRLQVEVENVSANQMPGRPSLFSDRLEKHSRVTGR